MKYICRLARPRSQPVSLKTAILHTVTKLEYVLVSTPASGRANHSPNTSSVFIAGATSLRNSTNHLSAATNGKKRPISPEQVLRLFGQGGAAALGKALPPSHPPAAPAPVQTRRHSPASSPSSTTHHVSLPAIETTVPQYVYICKLRGFYAAT